MKHYCPGCCLLLWLSSCSRQMKRVRPMLSRDPQQRRRNLKVLALLCTILAAIAVLVALSDRRASSRASAVVALTLPSISM